MVHRDFNAIEQLTVSIWDSDVAVAAQRQLTGVLPAKTQALLMGLLKAWQLCKPSVLDPVRNIMAYIL